jgi:hypothetical protein
MQPEFASDMQLGGGGCSRVVVSQPKLFRSMAANQLVDVLNAESRRALPFPFLQGPHPPDWVCNICFAMQPESIGQ